MLLITGVSDGLRRARTEEFRKTGGGCAVALVKAGDVDAITKKIAADYKTKTGIEATIFSSRPAAGAAIIKA